MISHSNLEPADASGHDGVSDALARKVCLKNAGEDAAHEGAAELGGDVKGHLGRADLATHKDGQGYSWVVVRTADVASGVDHRHKQESDGHGRKLRAEP